jgi:hypothetical protein
VGGVCVVPVCSRQFGVSSRGGDAPPAEGTRRGCCIPFGLVWFGLIWFGLVLVWFGLRISLVWSGLVCVWFGLDFV